MSTHIELRVAAAKKQATCSLCHAPIVVKSPAVTYARGGDVAHLRCHLAARRRNHA